MARITAPTWSPREVTGYGAVLDLKQAWLKMKEPKWIVASLNDPAGHGERPTSDGYRPAPPGHTCHVRRGGATLPEKEKNRMEKVKDTLRALCERPATGRTTVLGRRVEKPGERKPGGPSGQKDWAKGDGKHANK